MSEKTEEAIIKKKEQIDLQPVDYPMPMVEDMTSWPIHKLSQEKEEFMKYASEFTTQSIINKKRKDNMSEAIAKVLYLERMRIVNEPWKVDPPDEMDFWNDIRKKLLRKSLDQTESSVKEYNHRLLRRITERYLREIMSNFKIPTYKIAQKFLPKLFSTILNASSFFRSKKRLQDKLQIVGDVTTIRNLLPQGTIVLVPTHFSNLDSILVGWAADQIGLSAFTYGAGINLYNKILGYIFPRLGAYGLDRRKKNDFYLETLKAYSQLNMERRVHSIFFPGGTRSRSGALEDKLKMGLLGTAIDAQGNLFQRKEDNKIFIVPVVLNYHCVLEAKNLINSHLERTGKELYLIEKKAFGGAFNFLKFFWKFFSSTSEIVVNFGQPMDVLGNFVNSKGQSLDKRGNVVDLEGYFVSGGVVKNDKQRNAQYTKMLAKQIVKRYHNENVVLSSHLVAHTAFNILQKKYPSLDLYGILRLPKEDRIITQEVFKRNITLLRDHLLALNKAGKVRLSNIVKNGSIQDLIKHGIDNIGIFHVQKALFMDKQQNVRSENLNLLLYYHNRLTGYNLSEYIEVKNIK
ncbi:1-acyl-sn-glycerol-3-phosphate acyltransferase [Aureispira anguillae]|uniref:Glycerol-3-phosphate acyltransferase n=1 Tax=Aureispira anguillae TaxID=2864201 RepID=A0A915YB89_9BACT|nr:1-acyl-sn-glycerol-3-phosphate acyltransferase [Aureispira anguillae]BDS09892.1 1-acyl-sn-glycerol-3-phosphate acyltransferase [Aureispira anguillae]